MPSQRSESYCTTSSSNLKAKKISSQWVSMVLVGYCKYVLLNNITYCCWFFNNWFRLLDHWLELAMPAMALVFLRKSVPSPEAIVLSWTIRWTWTLLLFFVDLVTLVIKSNCPASSINLSPHKVVTDWSMRRIGHSVFACVSVCVRVSLFLSEWREGFLECRSLLFSLQW